jgi:uncharacterized damage-inducible protein DinB
MTIDDIRTLYAYNRWANDRILLACRSLSLAQLTSDLRSSHGSIRGTLVHTLWGEWIWFRRWVGESPKVILDENKFEDVDMIQSLWKELDLERDQFIDSLTGEKLESMFGYESLKGEHWEYAYGNAMQHVVNHSSYHRGQVVTLLRQLGQTPPSTDFLIFYDEGQPAVWK